ncbi:MAG TPA: M28 family peptidase [candidate division Zixibacteria bacterium]|nr:M28 family peptidase [candidate division Zixibacteria bacterium]
MSSTYACVIVTQLEEAVQVKEFHMVRRLFSLFAVLLFVFLAIDIVHGFANPSSSPATTLIAVDVTTPGEWEIYEKTGIPAYASLTGQGGGYLLAGADQAGLYKLQSLDIPYQVLEEDMGGKTYYIASVMPGRQTPRWQDYGRLLFDDGLQVLLRMDPKDADRIAEQGIQIQKLFDNPIVFVPEDSGQHFPSLIDPDPTVQIMIDQVISTTVYEYDGNLSGEWPVTIGGSPYTIVTRNTYSGEPIQKATQYVAEHLGDLGLDVEYHVWNASRPPNVIGEITGETDPEDIFLITAHLDDMPSGAIAPGADDNASGSTAVMIASEILSQYRWGCTLRFAYFTGEEQGLLGSNAYALRSSQNSENILGVLNLDMIGWNTPGSTPYIDLESASSVPGSVAIAQLFADVVDAYSIDLIPQISTTGTCCSDHVSFLNRGYPAILAIEDFSDFNPYYHSTNDLLSNLDIEYFTDLVRASVGTFAHMASCMIPDATGSIEGYVKEVEGGSPSEGADLYIESTTGWEAFATTNSSGYYTSTTSTGTYTVTASARGFFPATVSNVEIISGTVTTLDINLEREEYFYYIPFWVGVD